MNPQFQAACAETAKARIGLIVRDEKEGER
jgi:hypothetical protein